MTNDFVPFCNENTGTNLPTQSAYIANPNLPIGNQPGIASSSFNNKAIRQASTIAAIVAQVIADAMAVDMLDVQNTADHANPTALLASAKGMFNRLTPVIANHTATGAGNHRMTIKVQVSAANATSGAVYTDGTSNFTVSTTLVAGDELVLVCTSGAYLVTTSGTLTKSSGTGDATIIFYSYRKPKYIKVTCVGGGGAGGGPAAGAGAGCGGGGGGGGMSIGYINDPLATYAYVVGAGGAGINGTTGNNGADSTFNSTFTGGAGNGGGGGGVSITVGIPAATGANGGTASGGIVNVKGSPGNYAAIQDTTHAISGQGGPSAIGGGGGNSSANGTTAGDAGKGYGGGGGGAVKISGGAAQTGGAGADGVVIVEEYYQ